MKKKILGIVLTLTLVLTSLASCTTAEIGYLNQAMDAYAQKSAEASGTLNLKADVDEISAYLTKLSGVNPSAATDLKPMLDMFSDLTLKYDGKVRTDNPMAYELNVKLIADGKTMDFGTVIFDGGKGLFISQQTVIGALELTKMIEPSKQNSDMIDELTAEIAKNSENAFIEVLGQKDMMNAGFASLNEQFVFGQAETDLITNMFKDYSTGKVTDTGNGYQISVNLKDCFTILINALDYMSSNPDTFINALETYAATEGNLRKFGVTKEDAASAIAELKASKNNIKNEIVQMKAGLEMIMKEAALQDFMTSSYEAKTTKISNGLKGTEDLKVIAAGKTLLTITGESTSIYKDVTIAVPDVTITADEMTAKMDKAMNQINPVKKAEITWRWNDPAADVELIRVSDSSLWNDFTFKDYQMKGESIYLPLRSLSEAFGEEVGWDNKAKNAYIVRDGKNVTMEGMLAYSEREKKDLTYVKVRDFEKLGYKVDYVYDKESKTNLATLTK